TRRRRRATSPRRAQSSLHLELLLLAALEHQLARPLAGVDQVWSGGQLELLGCAEFLAVDDGAAFALEGQLGVPQLSLRLLLEDLERGILRLELLRAMERAERAVCVATDEGEAPLLDQLVERDVLLRRLGGAGLFLDGGRLFLDGGRLFLDGGRLFLDGGRL